MKFQKLELRPGIHKDASDYSNTGGWYDCDKVRFRSGKPEAIGGWQKLTNTTFTGTARRLLRFRTLTGDVYTAIGTETRLYTESGGTLDDITPFKQETSLGTDPLASTSGSNELTVTHTSHEAIVGDTVILSGATGFDVYSAGDLTGEFTVTEVVGVNSYKIQVGSQASTSTSGGGSSITAGILISPGLDTVIFGVGWGADGWGEGGWGEAASESAQVGRGNIRLWTFDTFGEDLIACARDVGLYYWEGANPGTRAYEFTELSGANNVPTVASSVLVSDRDRHVIAFGANTLGETTQDPLLIRWSDQENPADWQPRADNTSGDLRLGSGSRIVSAVPTRSEILCWTETTCYALRYIGGILVFGLETLAENITIQSPGSTVSVGDIVYWMGQDAFYAYSGQVREIPCPILDHIFLDFNQEQSDKVVGGSNVAENEIFWFYPSSDSSENDRYVVYNYRDNIWYFGTLARTAWIDRGLTKYPIAAGTDGYLYYHDFGYTDGSTNPPSAIGAYIESSPFEIGEGDSFMFLNRMIPDVDFRESDDDSSVLITVKARNVPGEVPFYNDDGTVTKTASTPVAQHTGELWMRLRGRSFVFRIESNTTKVRWRLGTPRLEVRTDGRR